MTFEYIQKVTVEGELEVDNIGDCVISAVDVLTYSYYLIIKTVLGFTEIIEYGPILEGIEQLPSSYSVRYDRIEYNQGKIERVIDRFLNNPKRGIVQAQVITLEEAKPFLVNPIDKLSL